MSGPDYGPGAPRGAPKRSILTRTSTALAFGLLAVLAGLWWASDVRLGSTPNTNLMIAFHVSSLT